MLIFLPETPVLLASHMISPPPSSGSPSPPSAPPITNVYSLQWKTVEQVFVKYINSCVYVLTIDLNHSRQENKSLTLSLRREVGEPKKKKAKQKKKHLCFLNVDFNYVINAHVPSLLDLLQREIWCCLKTSVGVKWTFCCHHGKWLTIGKTLFRSFLYISLF